MTKTWRSPVAFDYLPTSWWKGGNDIQTLIGCMLDDGPTLGPCVCLLSLFFDWRKKVSWPRQCHDHECSGSTLPKDAAFNPFIFFSRNVDLNICCFWCFHMLTKHSDETSTGTRKLFFFFSQMKMPFVWNLAMSMIDLDFKWTQGYIRVHFEFKTKPTIIIMMTTGGSTRGNHLKIRPSEKTATLAL